MEYEVGDREPVSMAVVRAVCAMENRMPNTLRPLNDILDPDALDAIFENRYNGLPRVGGQISFIYSNCQVTIESGEYVIIEMIDTKASVPITDEQNERLAESG